jgi:hypothetical protein
MENRILKFIIMAVLVCAAQASAQTAQFQFGLTVTDNAGGTQQLFLGVDPTGTDGIDLTLGEAERPPVPPAGVFDARLIGTDISISGLGQGVIRDYRLGTEATSGTRLHELSYQVGTGTTITISWVLPTWAAGRLQDILIGSLIDSTMHGTGSYTVTNPSGFNKLKLTVTYTAPLPIQLASFTGRVTNQQGHVRLDWRTITETNNYGFFVQRSFNDQNHYQTVSELVPGHGTTLEPHDYVWTDVNAQAGIWFYRLKQLDLDGTASFTEGIIPAGLTGVKEKSTPTEFGLGQNYPNPFNPSTKIEFALPKQSNVRLDVYNLIGQHVATLVNGTKSAGFHTVEFDATGFSSGLYFYRITANEEFTLMKKMVLAK